MNVCPARIPAWQYVATGVSGAMPSSSNRAHRASSSRSVPSGPKTASQACQVAPGMRPASHSSRERTSSRTLSQAATSSESAVTEGSSLGTKSVGAGASSRVEAAPPSASQPR